MTLEINPINSQPTSSANVAVKLSPEVEQLLADLKVQIGDKLEALVNKVTLVSATEQAALFETKTASATPIAKQLWQMLLAQPTLKLAELMRDSLIFTVVTNAPLEKGQLLNLLVTTRGIQVIDVPVETATKFASAASLTPLLEIPMPTKAGVPGTSQNPAVDLNSTRFTNLVKPESGVQPSVAQASKLLEATVDLAKTQLIPRRDPNKNEVAPSQPPLSSATKSTQANDAQLNHPLTTTQTLKALSIQTWTQAVQALGQAIATTLPRAQSLDLSLATHTRLMTALQQIPPQSMPPILKPLLPLLAQMDRQALDLKSPSPVATQVIAKAIQNSGVLYERNALRAIAAPVVTSIKTEMTAPTRTTEALRALPEDLKHLLILTLEALGQPVNTAATEAKPPLSNDAIARLWLGLVNGLGNKVNDPKIAISRQENLLQLAQTLAQNSLAKIQLNQYRSVSTSHADASPTNSPLHLDIPLKWPDQYGNAHLQIFRPEIEQDDEEEAGPKQQRKHRKQARWRVFMELDLGSEGSLAVDLSIIEQRLDVLFFAEKEALRSKASAQLQGLRKELTERGIEVTDMRCSSNPPPEQKMNLDYAIIDIQT